MDVYTVVLFLSARLRHPPLALTGAALALTVFVLALFVAVGWGGDVDAEES